jgi:hypothetical protein
LLNVFVHFKPVFVEFAAIDAGDEDVMVTECALPYLLGAGAAVLSSFEVPFGRWTAID